MFDPRTKLIFSIFYAILVMVSSRAAGLTVEWGALILLILSMAQGKAYLRWLRLVVPMSLFFGAITWWSINLEAGTVAALKLLTLTTVFFVFFSTTLPEDLGNALVEWWLPYTVAFVLALPCSLFRSSAEKPKTFWTPSAPGASL